ncbi:MAG: hypothetical protein FJX44_08325 [Alphaproteobacteria bacterium]|nr:hypothetical protein [Alphaproteobacteria bacterium]
MLRIAKIGLVLLGVVVVYLIGAQPADAVRCEGIVATNSAKSKADAARAAQQNARDTAEQIRRKRGWSYVTLRARKVTPDPFWKSVRPVVKPEMLLKPDIVTSQTYTQCWRGVVVPFVCTAGASACGG